MDYRVMDATPAMIAAMPTSRVTIAGRGEKFLRGDDSRNARAGLQPTHRAKRPCVRTSDSSCSEIFTFVLIITFRFFS